MIRFPDASLFLFFLPWRNRQQSNLVLNCSRRTWQTLAVVPILTLVFSEHPAFAAKQSAHTVYVLKQKSKIFGDQTVYVSPTALRLDMQRLKCSIVTKLPGQKFQMFSTSKKLSYEKDIDRWHSNFSELDNFEKKCKALNVTWRPIGSKNICGIACGEYILGKLKGSHDKSYRHVPRDPNRRRYYLAESIPISRESSELFAKICKITPLYKVPLRVRMAEGRGDSFDQLNTTSCEKKTVPASFFTVPPKYRKTENEFDIFVAFGDSADPMTGIEDILFRSTPGKGKPSE